MATKTAKRFTNGQTVFYASTYFGCVGKGDRYHDNVRLGVVIERQVDACGVKQITFFNRGNNDSVFGRRENANNQAICETAEEAFNFLRNSLIVDVVCPDVYTDSDKRCFDDLRNSTMRIAEK